MGRKNIHQRFKDLVEMEFKDRAVMLRETYQRYAVWISKERLLNEIAELNSRIRKCNKIWQEFAYKD